MRYRAWLLLLFSIIAGASQGAEYRRYPALEYARIGQVSLRLDLYVPQAPSPPPLVIYIHGGDWMYGSRKAANSRFLLDQGFAVASVDYRLAPRARFPAQIQDCRDALFYLHQNAARYKVDGNRIGAMGESAGGHLAALLALAGDEKAFDGSRKPKDRPVIKAVVSLSGPMDIEWLGGMGDMLEDAIGRHPVQQLLGGRVRDKQELAHLASPIQHISADDPPMLLIYGDQDLVVPPIQATEMQKALETSGVTVETCIIHGIGHDMDAIYRTEAPARALQFFREHLMSPSPGPPATRPQALPATTPVAERTDP